MDIKNILICGGGMMGKNIAFVFASNPEYKIGVYDLYETDVYAGIRTNTKQLVDHGVMTEADVEDRLSRISFTTDMDSELVSSADLVIEAVFEDMGIKRETFAKLEERCRPDTIFCTNSSVMSPSEISRDLKHRERFVGTHFWNPGHLIPLVEGRAESSSSDFMVISVTLAKQPMVSIPGKYLCINPAISINLSYFSTNGFAPVRKVRDNFLPRKRRYIPCASFKSVSISSSGDILNWNDRSA